MSKSYFFKKMFTINTCKKGSQQKLNDWFIIVNGIKCKCIKSVAEELSPIIQDFYKDETNNDIIFATEIPEYTLLDFSVDSTSLFHSICILISKIFCGEEIICEEKNYELLHLIGNHFKIQEIINKIEEHQKHIKIILSNLKDSVDFKEMIKLENLILFEMNDKNIGTKVKEYESLIKKIPIVCIIHLVINISPLNINFKKINTNEFIFEIIENITKIVPETLSNFLSISCNKFIFINSNYIYTGDIYRKKEINSLMLQMFVDGLMKNYSGNIRINTNKIRIPNDFKIFFEIRGRFLNLSKQNISNFDNKEKKAQMDSFIELILSDSIDSFHDYIVRLRIDINSDMKSIILDRILFINNAEQCSLIELSAFLGATKCFTYLLNKKAIINKSRLSNYAVAGGDPEIIETCNREECVFNESTLDISIEYHRHRITKWLIETKNISVSECNLRNSIIFSNFKAMKYLIKKGINMNKMIIYFCESNNTVLFKWLTILLKNYEIKMIYQEQNKTLLHIACEQENVEIVRLLISEYNIDVNSLYKVLNIKLKFYYVIYHISFSHKIHSIQL